ncbi:MAG: UDP-N-acetylmuramoyl-L-alanyl-D-glutamate--2,6-diaminopimelate ligase [Gammaproteobacteria bacterium]|nr:UDP-N-acetylmuramoyl-L-alanyl-D-glutamate--2,6-diaminopimelate ligase [Gammaproteobacteria bacterium]MDH5630003.1 UDP-N-acetylmuramoyl-L-alanyl-D-glutamate--2,6-diaminopimelate ligase [Gammaproteobacteria bacterium]
MADRLLKDILAGVAHQELNSAQQKMPVGELVLDSRQIKQGDTFVAVIGHVTDGRQYITDALAAGAGLVLAESSDDKDVLIPFHHDERVIEVDELGKNLSLIAGNYYNHPSHGMKVFAVTGTNGKTSCSYLICETLKQMNFESFLLGTLGIGAVDHLQTSETTTADPITIQKTMNYASELGAQFAAMEISSHGIVQHRAEAIKLTTAIFTNLSRDHLDYHGTMEAYGEAKQQLFYTPDLENAVINMDDKFGRKIAKNQKVNAKKWLVSCREPMAGSDVDQWIWIEDVVFSLEGIHAKVFTPWGTGKLDSPLIGAFNLTNLLLVIASVGCVLKDVDLILTVLQQVHAPPGRMQKIAAQGTPLAIVDYAHSPDALEKALMAVREHSVGLIWCVFGCGGDRDTGKRPLMAKIAEKLANKVVVTTDNPRTEPVENIKNDIFSGFKKLDKVTYIEDRKEAIQFVIANASSDDAILIAGKGHEDYQIIGNEKIHLSDVEIAQAAIEERANG